MIARDWIGETCFIIGGGPSVATQPIERLRWRKVIVINSSFERAPWADVLIFHDDRWWKLYKDEVCATFGGEIYTTWSIMHPRVKRLRNCRPPRREKNSPILLSADPGAIPMRRTTVTGALNIACLKGASRIVCLGLDGKPGPNGERNHYRVPYPNKWGHRPNTWERHQADVAPLVPQIAALGIDVVNASPGSAWTLWPVTTLEEALAA